MFLCEQPRQRPGDLVDRHRPAAADVERVPDPAVALEEAGEGVGDVADMHEVAPLLAILEDQRRHGRSAAAR